MRKTLRDRNQHVIGYIDVEFFSGRQTLRDSNNHVLGYYEPQWDVTQDSSPHSFNSATITVLNPTSNNERPMTAHY